MNARERGLAALLAVGLAVGVPGCGDDPAVCADVDTLQADVADLKDIDIAPGSLAELSDSFESVAADVDQLADDASSEFETEIDAVRSATSALTASVKTAADERSGAAIAKVSEDFAAFTTAVDELRQAVTDTC